MSNEAAESDAVIRAKLATNLVFVSSIGVIILVLVVIGAATWAQYVNPSSTTLRDAAQLVFTSILPLLGTWVGTVLAFYYTKENFESASRATLEAVRSGSQRLESTRVADKMMPTSAIVTARIPAGKTIDDIQTQEVVSEFEKLGSNGQKISRLLFLDDSGACTAILHRSVWVEMLNSGLRERRHSSIRAPTTSGSSWNCPMQVPSVKLSNNSSPAHSPTSRLIEPSRTPRRRWSQSLCVRM